MAVSLAAAVACRQRQCWRPVAPNAARVSACPACAKALRVTRDKLNARSHPGSRECAAAKLACVVSERSDAAPQQRSDEIGQARPTNLRPPFTLDASATCTRRGTAVQGMASAVAAKAPEHPSGTLDAPCVVALNGAVALFGADAGSDASSGAGATTTAGRPPFPVRIERRPDCGRCVVARTALKAGDVVLRSTAVAPPVLHPHLRDTRCAACFVRPSPADGSTGLLVCARCKAVKYCSKACQRRDWVDHKTECTNDIVNMAGARGNDTLAEVLLVARVFRRRGEGSTWRRYDAAAQVAADGSTPRTDAGSYAADGSLISTFDDAVAMVSHAEEDRREFPEQSAARDSIASGVLRSAKLLKRLAATGKAAAAGGGSRAGDGDGGDPTHRDLFNMLCRFTSNNFAVTDPLMSSLGAGAYPVGALLNHSCVANCVMSYEPETHVQVVRCLRDVEAGEELTHHYVDAANTTEDRQRELGDYHFVCRCARCVGGALPAAAAGSGAGASGDASQFAGLDDKLEGTADGIRLSRAPSDPRRDAALATATKLVASAKSGAMADDIAAERRSLESAVEVYRRYLHPLNVAGLSARTSLLHAMLLEGDMRAAVRVCEEIVHAYAVIYPPNHPMLGLQLWTLGDLYRGMSSAEGGGAVKCAEVMQRAQQSLTVSYGAEHEFVKGLADIVREM